MGLYKKLASMLSLIGIIMTTFFMGIFSVVITNTDEKNFYHKIYPVIAKYQLDLPKENSYEVLKTLSAWFSLTVLLVLVTGIISLSLLKYVNYLNHSSILLMVTGLICLIGSQLIAYPFAFLFFVSAILIRVYARQVKKQERVYVNV